MRLIQEYNIKKNNKMYDRCDELCFLSKNLYNSYLYSVKQHYEYTGKILTYNDLDKNYNKKNQKDYRNLPSNTSQQTMMSLAVSINSFFKTIKDFNKNPGKYKGKPKFPKYKEKEKGRYQTIFTNGQAKIKNGYIHFPKKTELKPFKLRDTKVTKDNIQQVRLIPRKDYIKLQIIYKKDAVQLVPKNTEYLSIDLGMRNIITAIDTKTGKSFGITGKKFKSDELHFKERQAKLKSKLPFINKKKNIRKHTSNKLRNLERKRSGKVKDTIHHISKRVVDYCVLNAISNITIGYNKEWKQGIELGKENNKVFVSIPFKDLIDKITYKAELVGIQVTTNEESYTSKCSALDFEKVCKHDTYLGKRRGNKFITSSGRIIHADVNGALNILRKTSSKEGNGLVHRILEGVGSVSPVIFKPKEQVKFKSTKYTTLDLVQRSYLI